MAFRNGYHVNELEQKKHPGAKCIGDFLVEHFGEAAAQIDGVACWGGWTFTAARFAVSGPEGFLQTICGGTCIVTFLRDHTVDKRPAYLVVEDLAGSMIDLLVNAGHADKLGLHPRRNPPRLRLVMSA